MSSRGRRSLFAQPMAIEPVIEETGIRDQGPGISKDQAETEPGAKATAQAGVAAPTKIPRSMLETRMEAALAALAESSATPSPTIRQGHLALLKRWYYRPEARRAGEIFFPDGESRWPVKAMVRGAGRVAAKMLTPGTRE